MFRYQWWCFFLGQGAFLQNNMLHHMELFCLHWHGAFLLRWAADLRYGWPSTCCLDVHEHPKTKKRKNAQLASASVFSCSTNPEVITSIRLCWLIMMWAPPVWPISCSSWGLANVLTLTRPGIKRGFLPLLLAVALVASVGCYCQWRVVQWVYSSIFLRISLSPPVLDLTSALFGESEGSDCRVLSLDSGSSWIASCLWSCDYVLPLFVQHHKQWFALHMSAGWHRLWVK